MFSRLLVPALLLAFMLPAGVAEAKTRLVVNCFWAPQHMVCKSILKTWGDWIAEATEGRVKVTIPPKSVAPPPHQWSSVEKGVVDAAVQFSGLVQDRITGPLVAMNPFIATTDSVAMSSALWETYQKFFPDEVKSVKVMSMWVITPGELWSQTDTPLNSMADLKSRKIWALPGTNANIMKAIGAGVVAGPAVQANEIISRGVVDAYVGLSPTSVRDFQLIPYTKSMTRFNKRIYSTSFTLLMNNDKWAEISPEDQAAIMEVSGEKFARMAAAHWIEADATAAELLKESGITIVDADPAFEAELIAAAAPLTQKWIDKANAAGIDGQSAYDFYVKRVQELSNK